MPTETAPSLECSFILGTEITQFGWGENIVLVLRDHKEKAICTRIQRSFTEGTSYILKYEVNFRKSIESFGILGIQKGTILYTLHLLSLNGYIALLFAGRTTFLRISPIDIKSFTQ